MAARGAAAASQARVYKCGYCHGLGHNRRSCPKRKQDVAATAAAGGTAVTVSAHTGPVLQRSAAAPATRRSRSTRRPQALSATYVDVERIDSYIVFDVETTGGSAINGRIIQVRAVACDAAFKELGRLEYTMDPEGVSISYHSALVHGFDDGNILETNPVSQIEGARRFVRFVEEHASGNCALAAHNGASLDFKMATKDGLWGVQLANHKLGTLYKHVTGHDIENAHDATADTVALVRVMASDVIRALLPTRVISWAKFEERERKIVAARAALDADAANNGDVGSDEEAAEVAGVADDIDDDTKEETIAGGADGEAEAEWVDVPEAIKRSPMDLFRQTRIVPGAKCRRHFKTALGAFDAMFGGVLRLLVHHTNLYAKQKQAVRIIKSFLSFCVRRRRGLGQQSWVWTRSGRKWFPATRHHIRVWLACVLQRALFRSMPDADQISFDPLLQAATFRKFISVKRYEQLWRFMHAADSAATPRRTSPHFDPLYKVREMMETLMDAWQAAYEPGPIVGVDESLLLFKGRSRFRVRINTKRHKVGIKLFVLAAASPAYVLAFDVKTQPHNRATEGVFEGTKVTMDLLRRAKLLNTRRSVCTDNDYTSMELIRALQGAGLYGCGVLRSTRVPRSVVMAPQGRGAWKEKLHRSTGTVCTAWHDNRVVYFLSNCSSSGEGDPVSRRVSGAGRIAVRCPNVVHVYNAGMGPIDQTDQKIAGAPTATRRSMKWWHKILLYGIDICISNAHVVFLDSRRAARLRGVAVSGAGEVSRRQFMHMVVAGLLDEFEARLADPSPSPTTSTVGHNMIQRIEAGVAVKRRCVVCQRAGRDVRTSNHCAHESCGGVHLCHPTRSHSRRTCWEKFHRLSESARRTYRKRRRTEASVVTPVTREGRAVRRRL